MKRVPPRLKRCPRCGSHTPPHVRADGGVAHTVTYTAQITDPAGRLITVARGLCSQRCADEALAACPESRRSRPRGASR